MAKKITRPKRCTECGKLIREENKSGLCYYHYKAKINKEKYWKKKND